MLKNQIDKPFADDECFVVSQAYYTHIREIDQILMIYVNLSSWTWPPKERGFVLHSIWALYEASYGV